MGHIAVSTVAQGERSEDRKETTGARRWLPFDHRATIGTLAWSTPIDIHRISIAMVRETFRLEERR
jgi:hypothetical protein